MDNKKISENFWLSEFKGVEPDPRLIFILQWLRDTIAWPITITDSTRTPREHIATYKGLELDGKIKTKGNGLGDRDILDCIPWGSRHLPIFGNPSLRAIDLACTGYTGKGLRDLVFECINSNEYKIAMEYKGYRVSELYVGVGTGNTFIHLDIDRKQNTEWGYGY